MGRSVRRNPKKFQEIGGAGMSHIAQLLPPIVAKMTWGQNETILEHSYHGAKYVQGALLPKVEETGSTMYKVDNCFDTIEFHKHHHHHNNIKHIHGDMNLGSGVLGDLKFNKIFSIYGLFITPDYRQALKNMYEHLLPGGEVYFMVPIHSVKLNLNKSIYESPKWNDMSEHLSNPDYIWENGEEHHDKLRQAFVETGFEVKEFEFAEYTRTVASARIATHALLSALPFIEHLNAEEYAEIEEYGLKFLLENTPGFTPGPNAAEEEYTFTHKLALIYGSKPKE
jgi:SAM-dependent methyltransferase